MTNRPALKYSDGSVVIAFTDIIIAWYTPISFKVQSADCVMPTRRKPATYLPTAQDWHK
jgi:hypothetical protein